MTDERDLIDTHIELLEAAKAALDQMCKTIAQSMDYTEAVDRLDAAITMSDEARQRYLRNGGV